MTPDLVERVARAICLAELTKDGVWFDHEKMQRAVAQHEWKWRKHAEAAIDASQSAALQQEGVGEDVDKARRWLQAMTQQGEDRIWRGARLTLNVLNSLARKASQSDASPPLVGVEGLREALDKLTPGLVSLYRLNPPEVARICDEELDRSGALLGRVRALVSGDAR